MPATRAQVTLSFDWLAFAVKLVWRAAVPGKLRVPNWLVRFETRAQVTLSFDWLAFAVKPGRWTPNKGFTGNASQSNESVTCARVAGTEVCWCHS